MRRLYWTLPFLLTRILYAMDFPVTTADDSCTIVIPNSLRDVINTINGSGMPDSHIVFQLPGSETITLACPLPALNTLDTSLTLIDGTNQNTGHLVTIDGSTLYPGFVFNSTTSMIDPVNGFTIENIILANCTNRGADGTMGSPDGSTGKGGSIDIEAASSASFILQNVQISNSLAQGGNGFDPSSMGGRAQGGAIYSVVPLIIQGSDSFQGTLKEGTPPPTTGNSFGWTLAAFPSSTGIPVQINPSASQTISFSDGFAIFGVPMPGFPSLQINGPGTVSLNTTATALTSTGSNPFDPAVYNVFGDATVQQGTLRLNGQVTLHEGNVLLPLPVFTTQGTFTLMNGASLTGSGLMVSSFGNTGVIQGAIQPDPGAIILFLGTFDLQAGTEIFTTAQPSGASTVMFANFISPIPPLNVQNSVLHVDISGNFTSPGVYALVLSESVFDGTFASIDVTNSSNLSDPNILYSPKSAPNSVLLAVDVPFGINPSTNIFLGNNIINSTVLNDPCAGIIVVNLLSPSGGAAALAAFFANQSSLTSQTIGTLTTTLNSQCLKKRVATVNNPQGPLAQWHEQKNLLLAQNTESAQPTFREEEPEEKRLPPLSVFPIAKKKRLYSLSVTPLGQFQRQDTVVTSNATLAAYRTKTYGAILGFDYLGLDTILVGGAASFAWTDLTVSHGGGGQTIWSGFGTAYSSFTFGSFFFNLLATGSYNHCNSARSFAPVQGQQVSILSDTPFGITTVYQFQTTGIPGGTAFSKYNTYQLVPHIDFNYEIGFGSVSLVPFILADLSISFTRPITETGNNFLFLSECNENLSLNTASASLVNYMLQSEAGLNLFEQIKLKKDVTLIFRQKASYVNRTNFPYTLRTRFLDTPTFTSISIHLPMQHMIGSSLEMIYRRNRLSTILTYEGLVGGGFLSNAGYIRFAYAF